MANYSYTSNGVKFSIPDNTDYLFGKLSHEYSVFEDGDITPLVNAVEIDWNGAQFNTGSTVKTLNTTGEVLSILQTT